MAKMYTKGFKPKSTTLKAKSLIRGEIKHRYSQSYDSAYKESSVLNMKRDADAYNGGTYGRYPVSDYKKGSALVDAGCFRCYYSDQAQFLSKIYGKKNVEKWSGQKIHNTYKHLIGREYASMLNDSKMSKTKRKTKKR